MSRLFSRRKRMMEDLDQDIRDFIERETQDNIERGMAPEDALYAALRKFGNVTSVKEETWDVWSLVWLERLWQDVRFGLRMLRRNPAFTAVAVATLALGIGANTAIFTVIDAVLLRPLPYPDQGRVVWATELMPQSGRDTVLTPEYAAWQKEQKVFDQFGAFSVTRGINLAAGAHPERILAGHVTQSFFPVLGIEPARGRTFLPGEERPGHNHVAILSHDLWQGYFNSDPNILGRSITLDGVSYSVIGVMPRRFFPTGLGRGRSLAAGRPESRIGAAWDGNGHCECDRAAEARRQRGSCPGGPGSYRAPHGRSVSSAVVALPCRRSCQSHSASRLAYPRSSPRLVCHVGRCWSCAVDCLRECDQLTAGASCVARRKSPFEPP